MNDIMKSSSEWLADFRKENASRMVSYGRGSKSVSVAATIGNTVHTSQNDIGLTEVWQSRDYLIFAAELIIDGSIITPTREDKITDIDDQGNPVVYKVFPDGEDCYRFSDKYGKTLRIYTKRID